MLFLPYLLKTDIFLRVQRGHVPVTSAADGMHLCFSVMRDVHVRVCVCILCCGSGEGKGQGSVEFNSYSASK